MKKIFFPCACFLLILTLGFIFLGKDDFLLGRCLTKENLKFSIIFVDRNEKEIYRTFDKENREWIDFSEIPESMKQLTLQTEDRRFYYHFGVDPIGILRAINKNIQSKTVVQGASTITQQLARKVFLTDQKTLKRKWREMFIAFGIESRYTKDEILEMYLNTVPYGPRVNGIKVAAEYYFQKTPQELSDAEILILTTLPKNPVSLSKKTKIKDWLGHCENPKKNCTPFENKNYRKSRIEQLLFAFAQKQKWSQTKTRSVWQKLKQTELPNKKNWVQSDFQHFRFFVRDFLNQKNLDLNAIHDGIIIKTTLDVDLQKDIYRFLREKISGDLFVKHNMKNFSVMILDHESRGPLVWIGSKYFWNHDISGQVDMLRAHRQTGSAMKPFIYSAAIDAGFEPPTIYYDSVVQFRGDRHSLRNSDGHFLGGIRMTDALAKSRNIPAAKTLILAGGEKKVRKYLDENFSFGLNDRFKSHPFGWTLSLGTAPIKLMDLVNGYATIATTENKEICPILEIRTFAGKTINNVCDQTIRSRLKKTTAFFLSDILQNIEARPFYWKDRLTITENNLAVKTGTSSKRVYGKIFPVDNLVIGFNPKSTVFFWGGNTDGEGMKPGTVAVFSVGKIWKRIAEKFLEKYPEKYAHFTPPENIKKINGEWATLDYIPPSYDILSAFVLKNTERGLNPLFYLKTEPVSNSTTKTPHSP